MTYYAIMIETPEKAGFVRENDRVCLWPTSQAIRIRNELKKKYPGSTVRMMPYGDEGKAR